LPTGSSPAATALGAHNDPTHDSSPRLRALELLMDGLSANDVAEEMGVSHATGYRRRKRAIEQGLLEA
jgi:transposase